MKKYYNYIVGWITYYFYYSPTLWIFIPEHIRVQIETRINSIDRQCYKEGSCKECGCATTALQMVKDPCKGNCYPVLVGKNSWKAISNNDNILYGEDGVFFYYDQRNKLFTKVTPNGKELERESD